MSERKDLLQNARKSDRKATGRQKLSDDQLEKVAGGFVEGKGVGREVKTLVDKGVCV